MELNHMIYNHKKISGWKLTKQYVHSEVDCRCVQANTIIFLWRQKKAYFLPLSRSQIPWWKFNQLWKGLPFLSVDCKIVKYKQLIEIAGKIFKP